MINVKKKFILSGVFLIGWLYPLSIEVFLIADRFLKIKEPYACPFDFNCDAMIGWCFYGVIISLVSFIAFFIASNIKLRLSSWFYLAHLNLPVILFILLFGWSNNFSENLMFNVMLLAVSLALVVLTLIPIFRAEDKKA